MKKLSIIFIFMPFLIKAGGLGTSSNQELLYLYISLITMVAVIVVTDQFLKYIFRKMREREALEQEQHGNEQAS